MLLLGTSERTAVTPQPAGALPGLAERGETGGLLWAFLVDQGVDQRDVCYRTPLMPAAQHGQVDSVRELLRHGAPVELHEKVYYSALMLAEGNGHTDVVRVFAEVGAGVDGVEITRGSTALIRVAKRGHRDTVRLLLDLGADAFICDRRRRSARDRAEAQGHIETAALL